MKVWEIARRLLAQNRWLYFFLVLWPLVLGAILLLPRSSPGPDDIAAVLHQECIYGLALVLFSASVQLGNEERSRRIVSVLCRAVSRRQYLFALGLAAWIPLVFYASSILLSSVVLDAYTHQLARTIFELVLLGAWTAAVSLFFASWLPSILASGATLALISATVGISHIWPQFELGLILSALMGIGVGPRGVAREAAWLTTFATAIVFFLAASAIFEHRDLRLKEE
jgi:hypothetical protein